ncbi:MAG: DNA-binding protein WhiA [Eubacterium sp.]|nr:DNA-binding protein WhiA [Eubacterium sp.]
MSYSSDVKKELCRQIDGARHCQIAELSAMLLYSGAEMDPAGQEPLVFATENEQTAAKYEILLKKLFHLEAGRRADRGRRGRQTWLVTVTEPEEIRRIVQAADGAIVQKDCCRRAFLRGAFLTAGSISDPSRSYHCEIVCSEEQPAAQLVACLEDLHIRARIIHRKQYAVVYIKESSDLSDLIGLMGARVTLMDFENVRILKEMRENVNRKVNCETANINKTVNAAVRQIEDIRLIERTIGFRHLPNGLDEMAQIRLQYPEATLLELGKMLNPPVGKSGVNHRLRKLGKIAETIRGQQGGAREW